jgi:tetratricopeptide (TPR) repeat protein
MNRRLQRTAVWIQTCLALIVCSLPGTNACGDGSPAVDSGTLECEYGVTLALQGDLTKAETAFVSLLSHSPGDARALNNLGNLALFRGQVTTALEFFKRAGDADSTDPGILMNQATALLLIGDDSAAVETAQLGVGLAGGPDRAASFLGLKLDNGVTDEGVKGSKRTELSAEEIVSLLKTAVEKVPVDTLVTAVSPPPSGTVGKPSQKPTWRSAGPRAGLPGQVIAVYWKR